MTTVPCAHCGAVTDGRDERQDCAHCHGAGACGCDACHGGALLAACRAALPGDWDDAGTWPEHAHAACYLRSDHIAQVVVAPRWGTHVAATYEDAAASPEDQSTIAVIRPTVAEALRELRRRVTVDPWPWAEPVDPDDWDADAPAHGITPF